MKKIFAILVMSLTLCVNANAQWEICYNSENQITHNYKSSNGNLFVTWADNDQIKLISKNGIFSIENTIRVRIEFYDKHNNMVDVDKNVIFNVPVDYKAFSNAYTNDGDVRYKILYHLKYVGNVRIITQTFIGDIFDMTIPMNQNLIISVKDNNIYDNIYVDDPDYKG
jgi:hypothetical protein